jgi:hypothetical protein
VRTKGNKNALTQNTKQKTKENRRHIYKKKTNKYEKHMTVHSVSIQYLVECSKQHRMKKFLHRRFPVL